MTKKQVTNLKIKKMKTKKIKVLTDMKKITVENSRAKAQKLATEIKRKYSDLPKAYRIMYLQHLEDVKELSPLEVVFFNKFINE